MPEMTFRVRWPDDTETRCYSPSLVVKDHLTAGQAYPVAEFVDRARAALTIASDRVRAKFGFHCTRAASQMAEIERTAATFASAPAGLVTVVEFDG